MVLELEDSTGKLCGEINVQSQTKNLLQGRLISSNFTDNQKKTFQEFEELANEQVFSLLDEIATKIESYNFKIRNKNWRIYDLQIFEDSAISFRIEELKQITRDGNTGQQ